LTPEQLAELAETDEQAHIAWEALLEGVAKSVAAELTVLPRPREILISGRLCRTEKNPPGDHAQVIGFWIGAPVEGFAQVAKEAAQGAALIADGVAGGQFQTLTDTMEIRGASGTALDHLYIQGTHELVQRYLP
jgi:predicted butyrate kinase (DUF1464 family)